MMSNETNIVKDSVEKTAAFSDLHPPPAANIDQRNPGSDPEYRARDFDFRL
jgi:hypothetical protein